MKTPELHEVVPGLARSRMPPLLAEFNFKEVELQVLHSWENSTSPSPYYASV